MSDRNEAHVDATTGQEDTGINSVEPPVEELSEDALEDVAGGAMCQVGNTLLDPGNSTVPTYPNQQW